MEHMMLDMITGYAVNEGMNDILFSDEEYKRIQKEMTALLEEFDALNLSEEQRLVVDGLISAYTEEGALYGEKAYQKGFRDCAA